MGIRVALGASRTDVLMLVIRHGMMLALIGSVIGIAGALLLSRVMRSQLFGVQPTDPATFVAGTCGLMIVVLAASYIPARRAMRVDPMVALRYE
jgi:ABC-type antimicrobial peptide transport system permease subunit